jgi:hypothetical protein
VDSLGSALSSLQGTYGTAIADARDASERYVYPENHDLIDFLDQLSTADPTTGQVVAADPRISPAVAAVRSAVSAAVIYNVHGDSHPHSNGLAIFLPSASMYRQIDVEQANGFGQRYTSLAFAQAAPNWVNFLQTGP